MEMLLFGAILIFMFDSVPFLLPWVIVKLTKRDDDEAPAEPQPVVPYSTRSLAPSPRPVATEEFMKNPFRPPSAQVDDVVPDHWNNSGGGSSVVPPKGVQGWSWGAFMLNWVWALFNRTWIGLLCLVPYVGFIFCIYLGIKGRELAWRNKRWDSLEHFNRIQRRWSIGAAALVFGGAGIGILAAVAAPAFYR
ncbi:MAG: hypothetical protein ACM31P_02685 [Actinomycetota bacterium]